MGLALDFLTNLDGGKGFKDHLDNDFDFSQFKVYTIMNVCSML